MGSIERQEERWTVSVYPRGSRLDVWVRDARDRYLALIEVPDTDEGRSTVAKMVAAPDALAVLAEFVTGLDWQYNHAADCRTEKISEPDTDDCDCRVARGRAALEAAKRLQP